MSLVKIIMNSILIISMILVVYMVIDLIIKRNQINSKKISKVNNNKYIIMIVICIILFTIFGILRNFE